MISDSQQSILRTIDTFQRMGNRPPKLRELARLVGLSTNGTHYNIECLRQAECLLPGDETSANYFITPKGYELMNRSPIVAPSPMWNDNTVVCRYEYWPTSTRAEYHNIHTDGTCSCKVERCFHLRQAVEDLPRMWEELMEVDPFTDWLNEICERIEWWLEEHRERILSWSKVSAPKMEDF